MTRATAVRAVLAVAVLLVSVITVLTTSPRLGLDLQGGTRIVLEARDTADVKADRESTDRALEVLRNRVDSLGVSEPNLTRSGEDRILVELPDVQDPREAAEVLGRTAQLTVHPVKGEATPEEKKKEKEKKQEEKKSGGGQKGDDEAQDDKRARVLPDESGRELSLEAAGMSGAQVEDAEATLDTEQGSGWSVDINFQDGGKDDWAKLTGEAACHQPGDDRRKVAIVLDDEVLSAPQVDPSVQCKTGISDGATQITGSFKQQEAEELALLIKGGALPVPVDITEQRTVGPTLGEEAIDASARAAVIGVGLTALFVIGVYRFFGGLAALALAAYALISYAALLLLGVTLTLPGLAGFVLAIGMAVDANILVFERAREEYTASPRRGLRSAVVSGFRNALSAIADSNITTLLAAGLLFFLASGPVQGFGVTLGIGVIASMLSALVVGRVLAELSVDRKFLIRRPRLGGIALPGKVRTWLTSRNLDVLRHPRRWLALSAALVVLAGAGVLTRGLDLGVDFTGGRLTEYSTSQSIDVGTAREAVESAGVADADVTTAGDGDISVRAGEMSNAEEERVRSELAEDGGKVAKVSDEMIGPSLGDELRRNALIALGVALVAQLAYLAVRFRWTFAVGAVAGLMHDVAILLGVFAWFGRSVDGIFLASLLTVIGYSVNDSVVVFDRVRELWGRSRKTPLRQIANSAVLQTAPRTVNTGMGALFILSALAVLGGESLTDFALALLVGTVAGTWSSAFTAVPVAVELEARSSAPAPPPVTKRKPRRSSRGKQSRGVRAGPRPGEYANGAQV